MKYLVLFNIIAKNNILYYNTLYVRVDNIWNYS